MSTQYTVDDSSSYQCFCGFKHCCCRWLNLKIKPNNDNILQQLRLEQQKDMQKQLQVRQNFERRRNRKGIFDKKEYQLSNLQKSDKKTISNGSSQNLIQPLLQTKLTYKKNNSQPGTRTHSIFGSNSDVHNNTTIIFDPIHQTKQQISIQLNSFQQPQENVQGFVSTNESKIMLELFLESNLFQSIVPKKQLTFVDGTLPQIMQKYGQMVSYSICIQVINKQMIQKQKQRLQQCINQGLKLSQNLLIAIEQIHKYFSAKQSLITNFDKDVFFSGQWIPNWERLLILLPKSDFIPENKDLIQCQTTIKYCESRLYEAKKLLLLQTNSQLYITIREAFLQFLLLFKSVCQDLYLTVRNNRVHFNYETAFKLFSQMMPEQNNKQIIKQMIKQRQLFNSKLDYMKDCHDKIWLNNVGQLIKTKINKDIQKLKSIYYRK